MLTADQTCQVFLLVNTSAQFIQQLMVFFSLLRVPEHLVRSITWQTIQAVNFCHKQNVSVSHFYLIFRSLSSPLLLPLFYGSPFILTRIPAPWLSTVNILLRHNKRYKGPIFTVNITECCLFSSFLLSMSDL